MTLNFRSNVLGLNRANLSHAVMQHNLTYEAEESIAERSAAKL